MPLFRNKIIFFKKRKNHARKITSYDSSCLLCQTHVILGIWLMPLNLTNLVKAWLMYLYYFRRVSNFASQDMLTNLLRNCISQEYQNPVFSPLIFCPSKMEAKTLQSNHIYFPRYFADVIPLSGVTLLSPLLLSQTWMIIVY